MKSFRDMNPYAVGLVSVLVIAVITGFAFMVGLLHLLENTYEVKAVFRDAAGLRTDDDVKLAGVEVGRVTGIDADRDHGTVIVTFVVNDGVDLGSSMTADISLETLLGAKYVRLAGPVEPTYLAEMPEEQRVIPVERTSTPYDVFELTRVATNSIEVLDTEALNQFILDLAALTDNKATTVADLVEGVTRVSEAINAQDAQLRELLDKSVVVTDTLAQKDQTIVALIDQSRQILDLLVARQEQLSVALGEGSAAVGELARLIASHQQQLDDVLGVLHETVAVVDRNLPTVQAALPLLGPGFYQQALAGTHGPFMDIFVRSLGVDPTEVLCDVLGSPGETCN